MEDASLIVINKAFGEGGLEKVPNAVKAQYIALANAMAGVGQEAFSEIETKWRPSMLKVVQAMTGASSGKPDSAKMGDLFTKGGLIQRPYKAVVVYGWVSRVRFTADDDGVPSCSAEDVDIKGRNAADKSISIYGDACNACPFDDQPFHDGVPTNCNNVMNALLVPADLETIHTMQFAKTAYATGRQLIDLAGARNPPWSRYFTVDTRIDKRPKGQGEYAVPVVSPIDPKTDPVPQHLQDFARMLCDHFKAYRTDRKAFRMERRDQVNAALEGTGSAKGGGGSSKGSKSFADNM